MNDVDKKLPPGARRFIAKHSSLGYWSVYDLSRGSLPVYIRIGDTPVSVAQAMATEAEAQAEADRLEDLRNNKIA